MAQTAQVKTKSTLQRTPKWVRGWAMDRWVVDSTSAHMVYWDHRPQAYAVPRSDVADSLTLDVGPQRDHPVFGRVAGVDLVADDGRIQNAGRLLLDAQPEDLLLVRWDKIDNWFEEDEEVYIHPRAPDHRIEILRSTRHVTVDVDGVRVADTRRPTILLETSLPPRYYIPKADVDRTLLEPSDHTTGCPYKGWASYHHVGTGTKRHENLVWCYESPFPESQKIMGLMAFFDERVDVTVDDEPQERPVTSWSR